jgi:arsenate reductase-like glutaredoxin family protein
MTKEEDLRVKILNAFMTCPHRDTDKIAEVHKELREKDPLFYSHLASWYKKHGELRDHLELFSAFLSTDPYQPNREVGLALFREQPPFMKTRILGYIKGKTVKVREKTGKKIEIDGGKGKKKKKIDEVKVTEKKVGLGLRLPTAFKTEVRNYLAWLEQDKERFDTVAIRNRNDLKSLYASHGLQIKAGPRAKAILFDKKYPEDSKLNVFKKVSDAKTPEEAAKLIVENKIPYTTAVSLVEKITPSVLVALINAMSPQELINNIASLQERGALDNPDLKKMIDTKLEKAKTAKNVSTLKSKTAKSTGRVTDEEVAKKLDDIADVRVKKTGAIKATTALFVDQSGSMDEAIEIGKRCAALVSGATIADLYVVCFNTAATPLTCSEKTLTGWEKVFKPIHANGGTSIGCALDYMLRRKHAVEQIVVITDEHENTAPFFTEVFKKYVEEMKVTPHIVIINVRANATSFHDQILHDSLDKARIAYDMYKPENSDYYGLPGLTTLLSRKSKLDLVYEIMDEPLLTRKAFR